MGNFCVNLPEPEGAQAFGRTLFWVCLWGFLGEINVWMGRRGKQRALPMWVGPISGWKLEWEQNDCPSLKQEGDFSSLWRKQKHGLFPGPPGLWVGTVTGSLSAQPFQTQNATNPLPFLRGQLQLTLQVLALAHFYGGASQSFEIINFKINTHTHSTASVSLENPGQYNFLFVRERQCNVDLKTLDMGRACWLEDFSDYTCRPFFFFKHFNLPKEASPNLVLPSL